MSSFDEMPGTFASETDLREEQLTSIRTRDLKTGRFVGAPTLVAKNRSVTRIAEGSVAGIVGGVAANQLPQNQRSTRRVLKKKEQRP